MLLVLLISLTRVGCNEGLDFRHLELKLLGEEEISCLGHVEVWFQAKIVFWCRGLMEFCVELSVLVFRVYSSF